MGFGGLGMWELVLIFMVFLLVFGAKRLPEIGQSLGKGIREFKGSLREIEGEFKAPDDSAHKTPPPAERAASSESEPRKLSESAPPPSAGAAGAGEAGQRDKEEVPGSSGGN